MSVGKVRLGELEAAVMDVIWRRGGPLTVPDVHRELQRTRRLAYTTVMTVMTRLHEKGLLERREDRRPYRYWPAVSREDHTAQLMLDVLAEHKDRRAALARFVERIGPKDAEVLAELARRARRGRR